MKKILNVLRRHKLLFVLGVAAGAGLILQALDKHTALHWLLGVVVGLVAIPLIVHGWDKYRHGQYGIDILAPIGVATALWQHAYWAALILVSVKMVADIAEKIANNRLARGLQDAQTHIPDIAHIIRGSKTLDVHPREIRPGDKLRILAEETVPADSLVIDGAPSFSHDTTNEPEVVPSGLKNLGGDATLRAVNTAADSQYQRFVAYRTSAQSSQSPFVRLAERFAIPFAVTALIVAGAAWVISGDPKRFLAVLVIATPYALLVGPALAIRGGLARASREGIVFKSANALESLTDLSTLVFGKAGVITSGTPTVASIATFGGRTQNEVLAIAAGLEQNSSHPLAAAIRSAAEGKKLAYPKAKHVSEQIGQGLSARLKNQNILIGRYAFLVENDVSIPASFKLSSIKPTSCFVAIDGALAGVIAFDDPIRPNAKSVLRQLQQLRIDKTLLLTGDAPVATKTIAKAVGIANVEADTTTAQQLRTLDELTDRPVGYVGTANTPAPLLNTADVSLVLGASASEPASKAADIVLLSEELGALTWAIRAARRTMSIARRGIIIGIGLSLLLMGVFATGKVSPLIGAALQIVLVPLILGNALLASRSTT